MFLIRSWGRIDVSSIKSWFPYPLCWPPKCTRPSCPFLIFIVCSSRCILRSTCIGNLIVKNFIRGVISFDCICVYWPIKLIDERCWFVKLELLLHVMDCVNVHFVIMRRISQELLIRWELNIRDPFLCNFHFI